MIIKSIDEQMKIVFLDVDGVLNCKTTEDVIWRDKGKMGIRGIDDSKVELLKKIIDSTGARIVVSSTWRINKVKNIFEDYVCFEDLDEKEYADNSRKKRTAYDYLKKKLAAFKLKIYDDTPDCGGIYSRGKEIHSWLKEHPEVVNFVILDDEEFQDFYTYNLEDHVVYTSYRNGLTDQKVCEVIKILT